MAVCDAKYKFTLVDIGDTGVMAVSTQTVTCVMLLKMVSSTYHSLLSFPQSERILPYVFIGLDAFGLKNHLLKPYPFQHLSLAERVFNYTSSQARRVIENAFGLAASRFRVLHRPVIAKPNTVISITKSIVALHNFLMSLNTNDNYSYCPPGFVGQDNSSGIVEGEWRRKEGNILGLTDIEHLGSNSYFKNAKETRNSFKEYFNQEGQIE